MTTRTRLPGYAPLGLTTNAAELGLTETTVRSELGSAVARSRRTSPSPRATIFLHGAAGSWTTWTPLLETAGSLGITVHNPVLLDLPGWGDGSLTASGEHVAIEAVCSLVKDCAEELGFTEWDIVGHSMGGFIALHLASLWPQNVMSVGVVSATGGSVISSVEHPIRNFRALPGFILLWQGMRLLAPLGKAGTAFVRALRAVGLLRFMVTPLFRHPLSIDASVVDALATELRPRPFTLAAEIARGYDADARWAMIECPVRAVKGDDDVFSTAADLAQLGRALPDSVRTIIADCGHFAAVERPDEVLVALGY
ncbi:alpha/beta fold hydrolase [Glaciihabitans sp. dw_435]|uniref:alpha/beta fold hydrolase n=1 Tax=Glaciihabitans sp. dw_435 TaxID=2720081 RepID=UPI001BD3C5EE|nr:alpha/beta hydrolase [Glaciihabitans sp. dw_435]